MRGMIETSMPAPPLRKAARPRRPDSKGCIGKPRGGLTLRPRGYSESNGRSLTLTLGLHGAEDAGCCLLRDFPCGLGPLQRGIPAAGLLPIAHSGVAGGERSSSPSTLDTGLAVH